MKTKKIDHDLLVAELRSFHHYEAAQAIINLRKKLAVFITTSAVMVVLAALVVAKQSHF